MIEQARELAEIGAGVQISANGAHALFSLGLEAALERVWCEPVGKEIRLWSTGETWKLFDLGAVSRERYGAPYFMIHRADLHRILLEAVKTAAPDCIALGTAGCRIRAGRSLRHAALRGRHAHRKARP